VGVGAGLTGFVFVVDFEQGELCHTTSEDISQLATT